MSDIPTLASPTIRVCEDLVHDYIEETEYTDHQRASDEIIIRANIPFVVNSHTVTLDHDKIEELGLFVPYDEHEESYNEFDTVIREFKWTGNISTSVTTPMGQIEDYVDIQYGQMVRSIAGDVHNVCEKGFLTNPIMGTREEPVEPDDVPLPVYLGEASLDEAGMEYETKTRRHNVGTRRFGITGVVSDHVWWEVQKDQVRGEWSRHGNE